MGCPQRGQIRWDGPTTFEKPIRLPSHVFDTRSRRRHRTFQRALTPGYAGTCRKSYSGVSSDHDDVCRYSMKSWPGHQRRRKSAPAGRDSAIIAAWDGCSHGTPGRVIRKSGWPKPPEFVWGGSNRDAGLDKHLDSAADAGDDPDRVLHPGITHERIVAIWASRPYTLGRPRAAKRVYPLFSRVA
jgi:hypothetical protein